MTTLSLFDPGTPVTAASIASFVLDPLISLTQSLSPSTNILTLFPAQALTPDFSPTSALEAITQLENQEIAHIQEKTTATEAIHQKPTAELTPEEVVSIAWRRDSVEHDVAVTSYRLVPQESPYRPLLRELTELRAFLQLAQSGHYTLYNDAYALAAEPEPAEPSATEEVS